MLKKLTIRNFGKHTKQVIQFDKGITCLVGSSYSGKSTILRALRWVMMNKPSGDRMIRWGAKKAEVILEIKDSKHFKIRRQRSKSNNTYAIRASGVTKEFKAFGNDVPDEIMDVVNVRAINFQQQHDTPYWFGLSAGQVNRELNQIVSLDSIDKVHAALASKLRTTTTLVHMCSERVEEAKTEALALNPIMGAQNDYQAILDIEKEHSHVEAEVTDLQKLTEEIRKYQDVKKPPTWTLTKSMAAITKQEAKIRVLELAIANIETRIERVTQTKKQAEVRLNILKEKVGDTCPICHSPLKL